MVQRENPSQAEFLRENWQQAPQDGRFTLSMRPGPFHDRYQTVVDSLKHCAGIPVKDFAVIAILDNGEEKVYSSASLRNTDQIFTDQVWREFRRSIQRSAGRTYPGSGNAHDGSMHAASDFEVDSSQEARKYPSSGGSSSDRSRRRHQQQSRSEDSDDGSMNSKRKRARPSRYRSENSDDTSVPVAALKTQQLMIGNEEEVRKFYTNRFRDMQQSSCKVIGKAFVKLVEPKKQTNHPYTKGDEMAPPWWPSLPGENYVRHKEPDHLLKPERIQLLVHILKMVVEPIEKQHPSIQKLRLSVQKLDDVTTEAVSNWFSDKEHPENAAKRPFLKEIFRIARAEERYKAGEIDGTMHFNVMCGEGSVADGSDDEVDEGVKDEDDEQDIHTNVSAGMASSDGMVSPTLMQAHSDAEVNALFQDSHRSRPIPLRYASHPHLEEQQSQFSDPAGFSRNVALGFQSPGPQELMRRGYASSVYQNPQAVYGWGSPNGNIATNGPVASGYYTTSPQSSVGPSLGQYQLPPPNSQQGMLPPPMPHPYDGLPGGRPYDVGPALGSQLRTGSLGHPHQMPPNGFQDYLPDNGGYGHTDVDLKDNQQNIHHGER